MPPNPSIAKLQQDLESERAARNEAQATLALCEGELREAKSSIESLSEALEEARKNATEAAEDAAVRLSEAQKSLETERASAARATANLDEARAQLQEVRDSLGRVATHRDTLAAECADLQKSLLRAQAKANEVSASGDAAATEIASLRSLVESERKAHAAELAQYKGSIAEVGELRDQIQRLTSDYSSLKAQYARDVAAGPAPAPAPGVAADEGVWLDSRAKAEIVRRIPRTDNNAPIFHLLGA